MEALRLMSSVVEFSMEILSSEPPPPHSLYLNGLYECTLVLKYGEEEHVRGLSQLSARQLISAQVVISGW